MHDSLEGHTNSVRALVSLPLDHPKNPRFVSGSSDGTLRLWDPEAGGGGALAALCGHTGGVFALTCFHLPSGGLYVVSGAYDNTLRLWDPLAGGEALAVLHGHNGTVDALQSFVRVSVDMWPHRSRAGLHEAQSSVLRVSTRGRASWHARRLGTGEPVRTLSTSGRHL